MPELGDQKHIIWCNKCKKEVIEDTIARSCDSRDILACDCEHWWHDKLEKRPYPETWKNAVWELWVDT